MLLFFYSILWGFLYGFLGFLLSFIGILTIGAFLMYLLNIQNRDYEGMYIVSFAFFFAIFMFLVSFGWGMTKTYLSYQKTNYNNKVLMEL